MNDTSAQSTDLVSLGGMDALQVFTTASAIDPILQKVRDEIDAFHADVSTTAGRKAIASIAYRVARAKTALDDAGKALVEKQKEIPNKIDATRRHIRKTLDQWRDEVRLPLTAWEDAEAKRTSAIETAIGELKGLLDDSVVRPSHVVAERLAEIEREPITEQFYGERTAEAAALKDQVIIALRERLMEAHRREAEAAELARLRAEAAERERREREDRLARDAAEKATRDAEARAAFERQAAEAEAQRERDAADRRELELKLKAEQAERRAAEAEAAAKRDAERAAERAANNAKRREADEVHRDRINGEALAAIISAGADDATARLILTMIIKHEVPHVRISY